jgi:hypothetical protein
MKPCPYCELQPSPVPFHTTLLSGAKGYAVRCGELKGCDMRGPISDTVELAILRWDDMPRRSDDAEVKGFLKKLRELPSYQNEAAGEPIPDMTGEVWTALAGDQPIKLSDKGPRRTRAAVLAKWESLPVPATGMLAVGSDTDTLCSTCMKRIRSQSSFCSNPCHVLEAIRGTEYQMVDGKIEPPISQEAFEALFNRLPP